MPKVQVFEFDKLAVDDHSDFKQTHFERLVRYNERFGNKYFAVGLNKITFRQYVGVIQVGTLTIEILPKIDRPTVVGQEYSGEKRIWQENLLVMLHEAGYIKVSTLSAASLQIRKSSLLDIYFQNFLAEVEKLVHSGLLKGYRFCDYNGPVLKGKMLIDEHITNNLVHEERIYTRYQAYDRNTLLNQILKRGVTIAAEIARSPALRGQAQALLIHFEEVEMVNLLEKAFRRFRLDRRTKAYEEAIGLAKLIILNYAPDLQKGAEKVLAILFDMNLLFEKFLYHRLKGLESAYRDCNLKVRRQVSRRFWGDKTIRPDIVLEYGTNMDKTVIVDTKWKAVRNGLPSDDELKQMYVYNLQFGAKHSVLLYPKIDQQIQDPREFAYSEAVTEEYKDHKCQMQFIEVVDDKGNLKETIGKELLDSLIRTNVEVPEGK